MEEEMKKKLGIVAEEQERYVDEDEKVEKFFAIIRRLRDARNCSTNSLREFEACKRMKKAKKGHVPELSDHCEMGIRQVWACNLMEELQKMDAALHHHKVVSMDSEFPGFLRKTPRRSDELSAFADMKFNVDNMKIIQLGITLSDENGIIAGTWEFNFKFLIETEVFMILSPLSF
ncbi:hypothetical protein GH714_006364 [Hevea brasiliensis]|uniref:Uncharacterized protein n=1 Tax=Hevea brasiliensis TaxID=3981 RepID=A0A6A6NFX7_HEVBR|nr:hypothetical protein GH714_006364 [Hevea brasiliensis]